MTVKELARLAGVSPATISLVLNNKKGVSEKKRQEILQLIEEHGYSSVKKEENKKSNVLFIKYSKWARIAEINAEFISRIVDSVEAECQNKKYNLTIMTSKANIAEVVKNIDYDYFYGIIILGTELEQSDYEALNMIKIPYVVVDNSMPHLDCNCVSIDNKENVFKAIEYFHKKGFKQIGYFKGQENLQNFVEREQGFYEATKYFGIDVSPDDIFKVPTSMLGAFEATKVYLNQNRKFPKCIFADNDLIAIGAMKALKMSGIEIPDDISVIGFDNIPFCELHSPAISTVSVDPELLGVVSLDMLDDMHKKENYKNIKVKAAGEFIKRQSTI